MLRIPLTYAGEIFPAGTDGLPVPINDKAEKSGKTVHDVKKLIGSALTKELGRVVPGSLIQLIRMVFVVDDGESETEGGLVQGADRLLGGLDHDVSRVGAGGAGELSGVIREDREKMTKMESLIKENLIGPSPVLQAAARRYILESTTLIHSSVVANREKSAFSQYSMATQVSALGYSWGSTGITS